MPTLSHHSPVHCGPDEGIEHALNIVLADQRLRVASHNDDLLARISEILRPYFRPDIRAEAKEIRIRRRHDGSLAISAFMDSAQMPLDTMFEGPEWHQFKRVALPRRHVYANRTVGDALAVEFADGAMVVLDVERWPHYFMAVLNWLLLWGERAMTLHSAVTAVHGCAVVVVGPSGAGKSTLAWALHRAGADYYGDEWAFFTLPAYELHVWERQPALRPGGYDALGAPIADPSWVENKPGDRKCVAAVERPKAPCPRNRAHLFFIDGFAEEPTILHISGGEAVRRIFQGMTMAHTDVATRLSAAADLIARYPYSGLVIGRPDETAHAVLAHVRKMTLADSMNLQKEEGGDAAS